MKLCVGKASSFDDAMGEFDLTPSGRGAFAPLRRRKCSKLQAVPCAFLLTAGQNHLRLDNTLMVYCDLN